MNVKVAAVQALSYYGEEEYKNVDLAVASIREAADQGVDLIVLPEGYPGPNNGPMDSGGKLSARPIETMQEMAKETGIHLLAGELETNPEIEDTYYLTLKLISPQGEILINYARLQPDHMYLNAYLMGGRKHILPGSNRKGIPKRELHGVVDTPLGTLGIQICSEIFTLELARIQMLFGARIILDPMNGWPGGRTRVRAMDTWHCIVRARAAENIVFVVMPDVIYERKEIDFHPADQEAFGMIAGPEGVLAQRADVGIMYAELDMDRLSWLRTQYEFDDEVLSPPPPDGNFVPLGCRPGQCHDRLPELYGPLVEPHEEAFDYFYFRKGLDAYLDEFERVKNAT